MRSGSIDWFATPVSILLFCILSGVAAHQPLHLDNLDFPVAARATAKTGEPIYYWGEKRRDYSGLYHPPACIRLLAAWCKSFGFGETQVRVFGMLCALLQGLVALAILHVLFGPAVRSNLAPWFWAVFLLNP
jgi:hypothetical protein